MEGTIGLRSSVLTGSAALSGSSLETSIKLCGCAIGASAGKCARNSVKCNTFSACRSRAQRGRDPAQLNGCFHYERTLQWASAFAISPARAPAFSIERSPSSTLTVMLASTLPGLVDTTDHNARLKCASNFLVSFRARTPNLLRSSDGRSCRLNDAWSVARPLSLLCST